MMTQMLQRRQSSRSAPGTRTQRGLLAPGWAGGIHLSSLIIHHSSFQSLRSCTETPAQSPRLPAWPPLWWGRASRPPLPPPRHSVSFHGNPSLPRAACSPRALPGQARSAEGRVRADSSPRVSAPPRLCVLLLLPHPPMNAEGEEMLPLAERRDWHPFPFPFPAPFRHPFRQAMRILPQQDGQTLGRVRDSRSEARMLGC